MRSNTTRNDDATIREALDFSGIPDLVDIIDRLDGELDSLGEENTKLNDRIESLETLLTKKDATIRDLESQIDAL